MFNSITARPLVFIHTVAMPCPYLQNRMERRLMVDISSSNGKGSHDILARAGFRRSQHLCYRPACINCISCVPIRVRVRDFNWTKSFRRVQNKNLDIEFSWVQPFATKEQFILFKQYQMSRHTDGEMSRMGYADFCEMIENSPIETRVLELRQKRCKELVGVMLIDFQEDGISAVYSFFNIELKNRSLGKLMILELLNYARKSQMNYVYLGYWIKETNKMAYKTIFRPVEILGEDGWTELEDDNKIPKPD